MFVFVFFSVLCMFILFSIKSLPVGLQPFHFEFSKEKIPINIDGDLVVTSFHCLLTLIPTIN